LREGAGKESLEDAFVPERRKCPKKSQVKKNGRETGWGGWKNFKRLLFGELLIQGESNGLERGTWSLGKRSWEKENRGKGGKIQGGSRTTIERGGKRKACKKREIYSALQGESCSGPGG